MKGYLNTSQAGQRRGISAIRIRELIRERRLKAEKVGRDYLIAESDLKNLVIHPRGKPKSKPTD